MPARLLLVSNGAAEDLMGARLLSLAGICAQVLPLVGEGRAYWEVPDATLLGPLLRLPSGGFPFASGANLKADLHAGLIGGSLRQWAAAYRAARVNAAATVVVGDAYALAIGSLAAHRAGMPLVHLQPLISAHYLEGLGLPGALRELNALGANLPMPYELALTRRARSVFVRDPLTAQYYRARGVRARWEGSFAMDILPAPERDLTALTRGRRVLALLPGSRGDHRQSLPLMLQAAARLPDTAALVAWPLPFEAVTLPEGWVLRLQDENSALARGGGTQVWLLRDAFGAIARAADVAIGTAGTANEQLAGLGVPVIGFATPGPQYTAGFAQRQKRLLGEALTLTPPEPQALAQAVRTLLTDRARYARAARAGLSRIGPAGALPVIARELNELLEATPDQSNVW